MKRSHALGMITAAGAVILLSVVIRLLQSKDDIVMGGWTLHCLKRYPTCTVLYPRFLTPRDYDASEAKVTVPEHVWDFNKRNIKLPRFPASELMLLSVSSNNTAERQVSQRYTFGRIFDLHFLTDDHFPNCILCDKEHHVDSLHCPPFRTPCKQHIFFDRVTGWWCSTRKTLRAVQELPKWLHILDDNSWINPITEPLLLQNLDPDIPYFLGDDYGKFLAGGPGHLLSQGSVKRLMGPPKFPNVTYHWPNGSHTIHVKRQIDSCLARMQGGDWCFYHGDWAITECLYEVGVAPTDLGAKFHDSFFCQHKSFSGNWFGITGEVATVLRRTHTMALHITSEEMFDIFYEVIVPFYVSLQYTVQDEQL